MDAESRDAGEQRHRSDYLRNIAEFERDAETRPIRQTVLEQEAALLLRKGYEICERASAALEAQSTRPDDRRIVREDMEMHLKYIRQAERLMRLGHDLEGKRNDRRTVD